MLRILDFDISTRTTSFGVIFINYFWDVILGREINYSIYGLDELRKKRKEGDGFINTVLKETKLVPLGNPDELWGNVRGGKITETQRAVLL